MSKVLDLSNNNGSDINYQEVKDDGVEAVILKSSEGSAAGTNFSDPDFVKNVEGFNKIGLQTNAYHFFRGVSVEDAKAEADLCLENLAKTRITGSVFCDVEATDLNSDPQILTDIVNAFFDRLAEKGYKDYGLYSGVYFLEHRLVPEKIRPGLLWAAAYNNQGAGIKCDLWQYTSKGSVKGVKGFVDLSISYTDKIGLKPVTPPKGVVTVQHKPLPAPQHHFYVPATYTAHPGDNLSNIAARFHLTVAEIIKLNHISDPNVIQVGEVLKLKASQSSDGGEYTVKSGDTISGIAAKYHVTPEEIVSLNHLSHPNVIYPGQKLKLPGHASSTSTVAEKRYVTVQSGDNLSIIAHKNHLSLSQIMHLNPGINHPDMIYPCQKIRVK